MNRLATLLLLVLAAVSSFAHEPAELTTVILVRHAEKVTTDPNAKDPQLSAEGQERAQRLARMLAGTEINAVYTTMFARTRNTAAPLATAKKLTPVEVASSKTFATDMATTLRKQRGTVLVVGHSNSTQDVIKALGIENAPKIEESEYDNLFIVTIGRNVEPTMVRLRY
jgi:2,3-bisphosphoglycerate-dependent phosphoglycerate mutase